MSETVAPPIEESPPPAEAPPAPAPVPETTPPPDPGLLANPPADENAPPAPTEEAPPAPTTGKPESIPEQFWDADKGEVKAEALAKSYSDIRNQNNQLREKFGDGKVPETSEDFLKDWKPPIRATARDGQKEGDELDRFGDLQPDDPVFVAMSKAAKNSNMSKGQFDDFMQEAMEHIHPLLKEPFNPQAELSKLGDGGEKMVQVNSQWIDTMKNRGLLNEDQHRALLSVGATALGVEVVNILRMNSGEKPIPTNTSVNTGGKTPAEAQAMLNDPRYREQGAAGDAYRAEVDKIFAEVYGTEKS